MYVAPAGRDTVPALPELPSGLSGLGKGHSLNTLNGAQGVATSATLGPGYLAKGSVGYEQLPFEGPSLGQWRCEYIFALEPEHFNWGPYPLPSLLISRSKYGDCNGYMLVHVRKSRARAPL